MKQFGIASLLAFKRAPEFIEDIPLWPDVILIRGGQLWLSLTENGFREAIGRLECLQIEQSEASIWFAIEPDAVLSNPRHYLFQQLGIVGLFLNMLWAVKDCCVNCKMGFLQWQQGSVTEYHSNSLLTSYSKASGDMSDTVFSRAEIQKACSLLHAFAAIGRYKREERTAVLKSNSRVALFFQHVEAGRRAMDPALRVMHGCSALESLLSTSASELSHQLSERTALLVGGPPDQRYQIFSKMKVIYDIRSKVAHGKGLKGSRLKELSVKVSELDELLRAVFCSVVENDDLRGLFDNGTDEQINERFASLLFLGR